MLQVDRSIREEQTLEHNAYRVSLDLKENAASEECPVDRVFVTGRWMVSTCILWATTAFQTVREQPFRLTAFWVLPALSFGSVHWVCPSGKLGYRKSVHDWTFPVSFIQTQAVFVLLDVFIWREL